MIRFGRAWGAVKSVRPTEEISSALLASWLPEGGATLLGEGDFVLEVVEPASGDADALAQLLSVAFGDHSSRTAEFLTMDNPVPGFFEATAGPDGIDESTSTHYRSSRWLTLTGGAETGTHAGSETLVVRPLRIVGRESVVVVSWGASGGYPRYPRESVGTDERTAGQLPGLLGPDLATQARLRGDPEWLVELDYGTGHDGPSRVPQMLSEWEDDGSSAGAFAETLFSSSVHAARDLVTEDLPNCLDRWESTVLETARDSSHGTTSVLRTLADLGGIVDLIDPTLRNIGGPTARDPDRYFAATPESGRIEPVANHAISALRTLRERIRTGLALVSAISTSRALEVAQESQSSGDRFQRVVSVLGATVLGPTLVVGLFGANTALPGRGTWWGLVLMIALMVVSAVALLVVLRRLQAPTDA
jgi:hypothetical protein